MNAFPQRQMEGLKDTVGTTANENSMKQCTLEITDIFVVSKQGNCGV